MRNLIVVCVVILAIGPAALGEPELKGTPTELTAYLQGLPKSITLTGESKVEVQADKAVVEISIKTENNSLETCLKSNQAVRAAITAKLTEVGIDANKIVAEKFSSTPRYGFFSNKPSKYEVRNLVKITIADEKDFQQIAKIVDQYPEVEYSGLNFKHSKEKEFKKQATEQAFDDLMKKKAEYEGKLGVTLTPRSFSEQAYFPQAQNVDGYKNYYAGSAMMAAHKAPQQAEGEETASPFGGLVFSANVIGEFDLKAK
jgi:uncharacterized protein YggE